MAKKDILSSSKKIKRKRKFWKLIFWIVILIALMAGFVSFARAEKFRIKEIKIENDNKLLQDQISKDVAEIIKGKYFKVLPKDNVFLLPKTEIEELILKKYPRAKSLTVETGLPNALVIKFEERKQEAILCYGKECGFLDQSGFVFEKAPYFSGDAYTKFIDEKGGDSTLAIGKNIIDAQNFERIWTLVGLISRGGVAITRVYIKEDNFFQILTKEGWKILINDKNEPQATFENLSLALREEIKDQRKNLDYIDLRFGNKVYFKYKK